MVLKEVGNNTQNKKIFLESQSKKTTTIRRRNKSDCFSFNFLMWIKLSDTTTLSQ